MKLDDAMHCGDGRLSKIYRVLIVGIGSSHGDDRAGWYAIDRLVQLVPPDIELRRAGSPLDILDWMDIDTDTHIIDAAIGISTPIVCLDFVSANPIDEYESQPGPNADRWNGHTLSQWNTLRSSSSHRLEIIEVMQLAAALGRMPQRIRFWGVQGSTFSRMADLSSATKCAVEACVDAICKDLHRA